MRQDVLLAVIASLWAIGAAAQPVHNYPYDPSVTSYDTMAIDWCALPNAVGVEKHYVDLNPQGHWTDPTVNAFAAAHKTLTPMLVSQANTHGHIRICLPYMAELKSDVTVPFMVMAFQVDGDVIIDPARNPAIKSLVWDDGGRFVTHGNPDGLVMRTGHLIFDINYRAWAGPDIDVPYFVPDHGLFVFPIEEMVRYNNGAATRLTLLWSAWSIKDPSKPVWVNGSNIREGSIKVLSYSTNPAADRPANSTDPTAFLEWGSNVVEVGSWMPVLSPLRADTLRRYPTLPFASMYNYGHGPQRGVGSTRFDIDLHNGGSGILFEEVLQTNFHDNTWNTTKVPFDFPAIAALGQGFHTVTMVSSQDSSPTGTNTSEGTFGPNEQTTALLGVRVLIDSSAPAPPPPPPPPPSPEPQWLTVGTIGGAVLERLEGTARYRLRDGSTIVEFVFKP